jgi:hypothetical protein
MVNVCVRKKASRNEICVGNWHWDNFVEIDTEIISHLTLRFPHLNLFHLCFTFVTVFTLLLSERKVGEAWTPCSKSILFLKSIELERNRASFQNCFILYVPWMMLHSIYQTNLHELKRKHSRHTISYTYRHFLSTNRRAEIFRKFCLYCVHFSVHVRLVW